MAEAGAPEMAKLKGATRRAGSVVSALYWLQVRSIGLMSPSVTVMEPTRLLVLSRSHRAAIPAAVSAMLMPVILEEAGRRDARAAAEALLIEKAVTLASLIRAAAWAAGALVTVRLVTLRLDSTVAT